ncbi:Rho termination factor N-terminal domain-containing protein, partial [Intestinibacillus massiliensis]|nr:Rho termination factor N-terminal domain-containing protein [Intestinibacillus massiliensis]
MAELREMAKNLGMKGCDSMRKAELIAALMQEPAQPEAKAEKPEEKPKTKERTNKNTAKPGNEKGRDGKRAKAPKPKAEPKQLKEKETEKATEAAAPPEEETGETRPRKNERKIVPDKEDRPEVEGILELAEGGFGFLRFSNFLTSDKDIYVSPAQIRRFNLKTGDKIRGISRKPN